MPLSYYEIFKKNEPVYRLCKMCDKPFKTIRSSNKLYCSKLCAFYSKIKK